MQREMKPTIHTKTDTQTWIAAPFTITQHRKPPRCPPTTR